MKLLMMLVVLSLSGCATITKGTEQDISFPAEQGKFCEVYRGDALLGTFGPEPKTITVSRKREPITVDCGDTLKVLEPSINAAGYTSIMWFDFGLVDYLTGAMWEYTP
jgi:hypothetical protein